MFISDEVFAQLHQEFMLEHKAKLRMITDNNKLYRILQEIKEIAEKIMNINLCSNCDGIGLDANCADTDCPYYQMDKILTIIEKAGVE